MLTIRELLDMPKEERSRYLAKIPTSCEMVFGALDIQHRRYIRRVIVRNGGLWREVLCPPGLYVQATFRSHHGRIAAASEIARWMNAGLRKSQELHQHLSEEDFVSLLHTMEDFNRPCATPVLDRCEIVDWVSSRRPVTKYIFGGNPL